MKNRILACLLSVLMLVAMVPVSVSAATIVQTIIVNPGESVSDAIKQANAGDTVLLKAGEYAPITVNKAITVQGEVDASGNNLVTIKTEDTKTALNIAVDGVTVKNLTIRSSNQKAAKNSDYQTTVNINNKKNVTIDGCDIYGYNGVKYGYTTGLVTFKNSKIEAENFTIHFDGKAGGEIVFDNCEIIGWFSMAGNMKSLTAIDTKFDSGSFTGCRVYLPTITIDGCTFTTGYNFDLSGSGKTVTVTDSTMTDGDIVDIFNSNDVPANTIMIDGDKAAFAAHSSSIYYVTLQEAVDSMSDGYYLYLDSDITLANPVVIPADKTIYLNFSKDSYLRKLNGTLQLSAGSVFCIELPADVGTWLDDITVNSAPGYTLEKTETASRITYKNVPNTYTITYKVDGETVATYSFKCDEAITGINVTAPTKVGSEFKGWDVALPATMPGENLVLNAVWNTSSYKLICMDEAAVLSETTYAYGAAIVAPETPVKSGYIFAGWVDAEGNAVELETMPAGNVTIYASWTKNQPTFDYVLFALAARYAQRYDVLVSAENATVTGDMSIKYKRNGTVNIDVADGYQIVDVIVNGQSLGAVEKVTFKKVMAPQTLVVVTEPIPVEEPAA